MPTYEYRCDQHGVSEIIRPLGMAPGSVTCLVCGSEARRVFSVAMVKSGSRPALFAAIDHAEKSRHEPDVVTSVPSNGAGRRMPVLPLSPAHRRLPRP
jgi:putative FmdB family regulatory protein